MKNYSRKMQFCFFKNLPLSIYSFNTVSFIAYFSSAVNAVFPNTWVGPNTCISTTWRLLIKNICKPLKQNPSDIHHISDFYQFYIIYCAIFYQKPFFWVNFSNLHKPCHVERRLYLVDFDKYILNLLFLKIFVFFLCFYWMVHQHYM